MLGVGSNLLALKLMDRKPNLLISAWSFKEEPRYRKYREMIREKAGLIVVDSGFLAAAKKGQMDWADRLDVVLECAEVLQADRVSMMDIPMEPHILKAAGFIRPDGGPDFNRALELTYRNAEQMMKATTKAAKGFVNQGWTLEHREECHRTLTAMGADKVADWWGIGTVCMRTPETGLFDHAKWCRDNLQGHIHCFGIAQPEWVRQLREFGIDSCDSATAASAASFAKVIANGGQVNILHPSVQVRRNNQMSALLYWYNMEAIEFEVTREDAPPAKRSPKPEQGRLAI